MLLQVVSQEIRFYKGFYKTTILFFIFPNMKVIKLILPNASTSWVLTKKCEGICLLSKNLGQEVYRKSNQINLLENICSINAYIPDSRFQERMRNCYQWNKNLRCNLHILVRFSPIIIKDFVNFKGSVKISKEQKNKTWLLFLQLSQKKTWRSD